MNFEAVAWKHGILDCSFQSLIQDWKIDFSNHVVQLQKHLLSYCFWSARLWLRRRIEWPLPLLVCLYFFLYREAVALPIKKKRPQESLVREGKFKKGIFRTHCSTVTKEEKWHSTQKEEELISFLNQILLSLIARKNKIWNRTSDMIQLVFFSSLLHIGSFQLEVEISNGNYCMCEEFY